MRSSSTKESNGAGHPILAKEQFGFDRRVSAVGIHRQSERYEGGAGHLHADHLAAFHRLLNATIAYWNEIGGVFTLLPVDGHAVGNNWRVERTPVVARQVMSPWTWRVRSTMRPELLFHNLFFDFGGELRVGGFLRNHAAGFLRFILHDYTVGFLWLFLNCAVNEKAECDENRRDSRQRPARPIRSLRTARLFARFQARPRGCPTVVERRGAPLIFLLQTLKQFFDRLLFRFLLHSGFAILPFAGATVSFHAHNACAPILTRHS